jgi:teichuronic acid exporter
MLLNFGNAGFADKVYMLLAVPVALIFYNFAILYVVWRNKN